MNNSKEVRLSKLLSWVLRHGAPSLGVQINSNGFVSIDELLCLQQFRPFNLTDIQQAVQNNDKKRFLISKCPSTGKQLIRATQGHSIDHVEENKIARSLTKLEEFPTDLIVHGTYMRSWNKVKREGLSKMGRNHIHFAIDLPGDKVISGMRRSCEMYIVLNVEKALKDGILFFITDNSVVISPGDKDGFIRPTYFKEVWQITPKLRLL